MRSTAEVLEKLPAGRDALFWMGEVNGIPRCVITPAGKMDRYLDTIRAIVREDGMPSVMVKGVLSRLSSGTLALSIEEGLEKAQRLYAALCQESFDATLPPMVVIARKGRAVSGATMVTDLKAELETIEMMMDGESGVFCLIQDPNADVPHLLLDLDSEALKMRAVAHTDDPSNIIRGQIRHVDGEGFMLRSKQPAERVQKMLRNVVQANAKAWPALSALRGARAQQQTVA